MELTAQDKLIYDFAKEIEGKVNVSHSRETIDMLFNYHNILYPRNKQTSKNCSACRKKCYDRLMLWKNTIDNITTAIEQEIIEDKECCKKKPVTKKPTKGGSK